MGASWLIELRTLSLELCDNHVFNPSTCLSSSRKCCCGSCRGRGQPSWEGNPCHALVWYLTLEQGSYISAVTIRLGLAISHYCNGYPQS